MGSYNFEVEMPGLLKTCGLVNEPCLGRGGPY